MHSDLNITPRLLMGPGPSNVPDTVLEATAQPTIGHLDPQFIAMMDGLKQQAQYVLQTDYPITFALSGPGSAGMEACIANMVEPGQSVVVCRNGVFSERMHQLLVRLGAQVHLLDFPWGQPVDPVQLESYLDSHRGIHAVCFVHAETGTGVLSDAKAIAQICQRAGVFSIADVVVSVAGVPVRTAEWGIDVAYTGSQKCLSAPPGTALITVSPAAMEHIKARKSPTHSWLFDIQALTQYWGDGQQQTPRSYHHTAPVNALYGMYEALYLVQEEGLDAIWARHRHCAQMLAAGIRALGLAYAIDASVGMPQLHVVRVPEGICDKTFRGRLLHEHHLEIGAGLGDWAGEVWRIGLMGHTARPENVSACIHAIGTLMNEMGVAVDTEAAVVATRAREQAA